MPARSTRFFEPTGSPVATYSSTTRSRISRWRLLRSGPGSITLSPAKRLRQEVGRDAAAEEAASLGQNKRLAAVHTRALGEAEPLEPRERIAIDRPVQP